MVFQKCSRDSEFAQDSICNGFGRRIRTGDTGKGVAASRDVFWGLEDDLRLAISVRTAIEYHQNIIKNGPQLLSPDFRNSVLHKKFWEFVLKNMGVENRYFSTELLFSRFKELARRLDWDDEASDLKCIIEEILNEDVETNFIASECLRTTHEAGCSTLAASNVIGNGGNYGLSRNMVRGDAGCSRVPVEENRKIKGNRRVRNAVAEDDILLKKIRIASVILEGIRNNHCGVQGVHELGLSTVLAMEFWELVAGIVNKRYNMKLNCHDVEAVYVEMRKVYVSNVHTLFSSVKNELSPGEKKYAQIVEKVFQTAIVKSQKLKMASTEGQPRPLAMQFCTQHLSHRASAPSLHAGIVKKNPEDAINKHENEKIYVLCLPARGVYGYYPRRGKKSKNMPKLLPEVAEKPKTEGRRRGRQKKSNSEMTDIRVFSVINRAQKGIQGNGNSKALALMDSSMCDAGYDILGKRKHDRLRDEAGKFATTSQMYGSEGPSKRNRRQCLHLTNSNADVQITREGDRIRENRSMPSPCNYLEDTQVSFLSSEKILIAQCVLDNINNGGDPFLKDSPLWIDICKKIQIMSKSVYTGEQVYNEFLQLKTKYWPSSHDNRILLNLFWDIARAMKPSEGVQSPEAGALVVSDGRTMDYSNCTQK